MYRALRLVKAAIESRDRNFEVKAGEGDQISRLVNRRLPGVISQAETDFDALSLLGDEEVFLEAIEFLVVAEFQVAIEGFGTG